MYVSGFVMAVPEGNQESYRAVAVRFWEMARDAGALSQVEAWEDNVEDGKLTDFRRSVLCQPGERVVFSWITWADKAAAEAGNAAMEADPRMAEFGEMPFDTKRMIWGGFSVIVNQSV